MAAAIVAMTKLPSLPALVKYSSPCCGREGRVGRSEGGREGRRDGGRVGNKVLSDNPNLANDVV